MIPKALVRSFWSHKFWNQVLRYEVALCIKTGDICWINGPDKCGNWNDIIIFRDSLMLEVEEGKRVEADECF